MFGAGFGSAVALLGVTWGIASWASSGDRFELQGAMTLTDGATSTTTGCAGYRGYNDITVGAGVYVYDQQGTLVASGRLTQSVHRNDGACVFGFTVPDVPGGQDFYQVEVSHRGKVPVDETTARAGMTQLTLGG
ncbi:hypothetical protein ACWEV3_40910 [Saccharopolyspora sp. NPDC003752]